MPSFDYITDEQGERVYEDSDVQLAYINLGRLSDFVGNCQIKTDLEYTNICQNVSADGNVDSSTDFFINLLVGGFEFMGDIEFPWVGKTGGKIAGWLLSALVDTWRSAAPPNIQDMYNNVWNGTKDFYDTVKLTVDGWREGLTPTDGPGLWEKPFVCPKTGETVTISQLATCGYLPDKETVEFDSGAIAIANQGKYLINKILVPSRWAFRANGDDNWWNCYYTRWNDSHPYEGPFYDGLTAQYFFGVYTSFPDLDVIDAQSGTDHSLYFSQEDTDMYEHNWFSDDRLYKGTKYRRWNLINKHDGGTAPDSFVGYLFTDGPGGDAKHGVASHGDIFQNWGLQKQT